VTYEDDFAPNREIDPATPHCLTRTFASCTLKLSQDQKRGERMSDLLSIQEVAEITGLHEITIRRYVRSGELEAVRIGQRIRVRRAALDK